MAGDFFVFVCAVLCLSPSYHYIPSHFMSPVPWALLRYSIPIIFKYHQSQTSVVLTQLSCFMFLTIQTYQFTASWFTVCQFGLFRPLKTNTHNSFLLWGSNTSIISIIPIPFLSYQYLLYWNQLPYPLRPITFTIDTN